LANMRLHLRTSRWIDRAAAGTPVGPSLQSLNDLKMAESLLKEGRMLGFKAFAIATTMCISGAVLVVGGTRWALDVETVKACTTAPLRR